MRLKIDIKKLDKKIIIPILIAFSIAFASLLYYIHIKTFEELRKISLIDLLLMDKSIKFGNNSNAYMIMWTDYACPFCARFWINSFFKIKSDFIDAGKLTFIVRDMPIPQLHGVQPFWVAQFMRCVVKYTNDTNYYANLAYKLYSNRTWIRLDYENLSHYLFTLLSLPEEIHNNIVDCYYNNDTAYEVYRDYQIGTGLRILGTPFFFIITKKEYLTKEEFDEIKNRLSLYGISINLTEASYNGTEYYIFPLIGALPYEEFKFILERVTS